MKTPACKQCLFHDACSGVYEAYARLNGLGELIPVDEARLDAADPRRRLLPLHLSSRRSLIDDVSWPGSPGSVRWSVTADDEVTVGWDDTRSPVVSLRPPAEGGAAACDLFSMHLRAAPADTEVTMAALRALFDRLSAGRRILHPLGEDALSPPPATTGRRLLRLKRASPFPHLDWIETLVRGSRAEITLDGPEGEKLLFWLDEQAGKPTGGYRLLSGEASAPIVEGLKAMMAAISSKAA